MSRGERFKLARERAELSQGQVAEYAETSQSYLSDIELNKRWPSTWSLLQRLAELCRVPTDYLLGLTDDPSPRRDAPLPEVVRDVIEIMLGLSEGRRAELLAHARVLDEAELAAGLAAYDQVIAYLAALPNGEELVVGFEEALRAGAPGLPADVAAAERIVDALAAMQAAKEAGEEPVE